MAPDEQLEYWSTGKSSKYGKKYGNSNTQRKLILQVILLEVVHFY